MRYRLADLIDLKQFQSLMDRLNGIYSFPSAIIDNDGTILISSGWQDICTKFHRPNKECEKECIKSDQYILEHLAEASPAVGYRCPHGLIDNAMPIIVDGHHLGSFFTGQFFLEEPDLEFFREQAGKFGFDEEAYLEAVKKVPVWGQEQLDSYLFFMKEMVEVLSSVGLKRLQEIEAAKALRKSEESLSTTLNSIGDAVIAVDVQGCITRINPVAETMTGWSNAEALGRSLDQVLQIVHATTREKVDNPVEKVLREGVTVGLGNDTILIARDGTQRKIADSTAPIREADGAINGFVLVFRDVTEAHDKYKQLRKRERELSESRRIAQLGSWSFHLESKEVVWSDEVYKMYGLDPTLPPPLYTDFQTLLTPQSWENLSACIQTTLDMGTPFELEVEHARADGSSGWMWTCGEAILDANGAVIGLHGVVRDITDRRRAEEKLRESEYFFKESQRAAFIGSYKLDFITEKWESSEVLDQIFGIDQDFVRTIQNWAEIVHPDDREMMSRYLREEVIEKSKPFNKEYRITRKSDGDIRWVNGLGEIQMDREGHVVRMIGTIQDITDRKRDEGTLRKAQVRARTIIDMVRDPIFVKDNDHRIIHANQAFYDLFGLDENAVIGKTLSENVPADEREHFLEVDRRVLDTGVSERCEETLTVNGLTRTIITSKTRFVEDSGEKLLVASIHDITERKRAEEERERLMAAIEQVAETIVITDAEGTILYVNPFFEQTTGYTCEEATGQNPRILNSGEHDDTFFKAMWDILTRGEVWKGRIVNKKKDGTKFTEEATISPVRDTSGKTVNYVAAKRDITHEIELNTQLRQAQKMEAVGQLAGGIAHDFNNLLQAILGYGYLALREVGADRPAHAFIEEMMRAGERATTLVGQLLAFSRRQVLELKDVNLNDSIADVLKMLRRVIGEHITIEVIPCKNLGIVRADPGQIDQILMNLCVNARDAMGKSGKITIETENVQIGEEFCEVYTWAQPGRYVLLSVTDTGCGMDQETLSKVFEPFFTTKDVGKGTGLGLATVYGVVKQHEGLVHVYSEVGKGTTFKVYLPRVERSAAVVADKSDGPVPTGTETILVAEDNEMLLKLTKFFLEFAGYTVLTAVDGEEALRVFEEHGDHIDMGLLDVMMPKLSGRAVYERIRETRPDMPFLFASGYSMNALHTNFVLDEGLQLVQKPFRRVDLLRKVREVLDGRSAAKKNAE